MEDDQFELTHNYLGKPLYDKNNICLKRLGRGHYDLRMIMTNKNVDLFVLMDYSILPLIQALNPALINNINFDVDDVTIVYILFQDVLKKFGLKQKFMNMSCTKEETEVCKKFTMTDLWKEVDDTKVQLTFNEVVLTIGRMSPDTVEFKTELRINVDPLLPSFIEKFIV